MNDLILPPGETLEVLAADDSGSLAVIKLKHYVVRLRHDGGVISVIAPARDHRAAISRVTESAAAPRSAVVSVQRIKLKHRPATANPTLKTLKYAN